MTGPFSGVRILSLAEQFPGPYATLLLADMGAEVVLVERPTGGDPSRNFPGFFAALNRNKKSVCLDLKSDTGREAFLKLVRTSDVVIEGFRPGAMAKLGLDYDRLRGVKDDLIYASVSGFGQIGPYAARAAHDLSLQAISGLLGSQQDGPMETDLPYADLCGAMFAALGIASALAGRFRTGRGTYLDVSMTDGLVSWLTFALGPAANGEPPIDVTEEPAYGCFACRDGHALSLSIAHEDHFWRKLCDILQFDPQLKKLDHDGRVARQDALCADIARALLEKPLSHWADKFEAERIAWAPVYKFKDVLQDTHFKARGMFGHLRLPGGGDFSFVGPPLKFSCYETAIPRPWPALGADTDSFVDQISSK